MAVIEVYSLSAKGKTLKLVRSTFRQNVITVEISLR